MAYFGSVHDSAPAPRASRILVVDDEPTLRIGFRLALMTEGYEVETAAKGEEALVRLQEGDLDLLILDLRMPGLDGPGVLRKLRAHHQFVPTVVASAYVDDAVVQETMLLGAVDYLSKPVRPDELRDIAQLVLEEEQRFTRRSAGELDPVATARCLLRRGDVEGALDTLEATPEEGEEEHLLWRRVAKLLLADKTNKPTVSLQELVHWYPPSGEN